MNLNRFITMFCSLIIAAPTVFGFPIFSSTSTTTVGNDPAWNLIVERNQDNASGVMPLQVGETDLTGFIKTQLKGSSLQKAYKTSSPSNNGAYQLSIYDVEFYLDSQLTSSIRAHVATEYDYNFITPASTSSLTKSIFISEAYATFYKDYGNIYGKFGRQYLNFGSIIHSTVNTPLTQLLAQIDQPAATVGFVNLPAGLYADASVYDGQSYGTPGSTGQINSSYQAHGYTAEIGLTKKINSTQGLNAYVDYLGNLADTLAFIPDGTSGLATFTTPLTHQVPGLAAHLTYNIGAYRLLADYVTALTSFSQTQWSYNNEGAVPATYALEGDYNFSMMNKANVVTLGLQGSQQMAGFTMSTQSFPTPASMLVAAYTITLTNNLKVGVEYDYAQDYSTSVTSRVNNSTYQGTGESDNTITARLTAWF
jgi:hypothetical protein